MASESVPRTTAEESEYHGLLFIADQGMLTPSSWARLGELTVGRTEAVHEDDAAFMDGLPWHHGGCLIGRPVHDATVEVTELHPVHADSMAGGSVGICREHLSGRLRAARAKADGNPDYAPSLHPQPVL